MYEAVTVYTKPACPDCDRTKKFLTLAGVDYTPVDVTENPAALAYITDDLGYRAAPVIVVNYPDGETDHWAGTRPNKIQQLR